MERKKYPNRVEDYQLFEMVGHGVSAVVRRARCIPLDEILAVKILDFERHNSDLNNISREAQTMTLIDHPNVLKSHCSFVHDHDLWVVMPYMAGGSCLHIMKCNYPDGLEEAVIASVLREVLKGLEYLHHQGHIHRDVKAGNILIDSRGGVKLGDFGVSACLFDSGDRQRTRNTFVGTPCWMAPEVMEQVHGYDFKADIWSFGITALELAHGHAPFSKYPPMKVLLMTLQNAPPGLDYERDKKFSRHFRQMIGLCLVKDPSRRPSAKKLLKHPFFKQARSNDYTARKLLEGMPALGDRYQALKEKEEDMLAQKKMPDEKKEQLSQNEYKRGISSWDFDIEDLKAQASLIPDGEDTNSGKVQESWTAFYEQEKGPEGQPCSRSCSISKHSEAENDSNFDAQVVLNSPDQARSNQRLIVGSSENEKEVDSGNQNGTHSALQPPHSNLLGNSSGESCQQPSVNGKYQDSLSVHQCQEHKISSSCSLEHVPSLKGESLKQDNIHNSNGIMAHVAADMTQGTLNRTSKPSGTSTLSSEDFDEKSKVAVVQQRGRFKVTSESVDNDKAIPLGLQKSHSLQVISQAPVNGVLSSSESTSNLSSSIYPQLCNILQANILQRDSILSLMKQLSMGDVSGNRYVDGLEVANDKEKELLQEVVDLEKRLHVVNEELQKLKAKNSQVSGN